MFPIMPVRAVRYADTLLHFFKREILDNWISAATEWKKNSRIISILSPDLSVHKTSHPYVRDWLVSNENLPFEKNPRDIIAEVKSTNKLRFIFQIFSPLSHPKWAYSRPRWFRIVYFIMHWVFFRFYWYLYPSSVLLQVPSRRSPMGTLIEIHVTTPTFLVCVGLFR